MLWSRQCRTHINFVTPTKCRAEKLSKLSKLKKRMNEENETGNNNLGRERRRKRQREASPQTDEEVGYDSDQNGDLHESFRPSQWQEEITQKINELLDILRLFEDLKGKS